MKNLILLLFMFLFVTTVFSEENRQSLEMRPFIVNENWIVWKVITDKPWVEVQFTKNLKDPQWETILIHGEEPPNHFVQTPRFGDRTFYRTLPWEK